MLYFVGGASRAGKSSLARKLLMQHYIPYFSVDMLMMGFVQGMPEFRLDPDAPEVVRAEQLWPLLKQIAVSILEEEHTHPTYLLEGDELLPRHVSELAQGYPGKVRACFMGYTNISPEEKLQAVRRREADWMQSYTDEQVLAFLAGAVDFSHYLRQECTTYSLPYIDASADMCQAIETACNSLLTL
jgi:hypothetical protein